MEDVHKTTKTLCRVDSSLCKLVRKMSQVNNKCRCLGPKTIWSHGTFITGSLGEGAVSAKCFGLHNVVRIFEADYMTPIGQIKDAEEKLNLIDHSPGFFTMKTNDLLQCMHINERNKYEEWQTTQEKPRTDDACQALVSKFAIEKLLPKLKRKEKAFELLADNVFQPHQPSKAETTFTANGPSAETVVKMTSCSRRTSY